MNRYFLEVAYDGYKFSGFQIQNNAETIQSKIENAFVVLLKKNIKLTGSSRTDAQVNAYQNYFHFDSEIEIEGKIVYNLNAILPIEIVIKSLQKVAIDSHARFSATSRVYEYIITENKNPFLQNKAFYFPYQFSIEKLNEAASYFQTQKNFINFSKTNTEVKNFQCSIYKSFWQNKNDALVYTVEANRFLRGMVKALVGTTLQYAKNKISQIELQSLFKESPIIKADFSPPGYGLYLKKVNYPSNLFL